jgi:hypothetical protein
VSDRCIEVNGNLIRVSKNFDATEGSDDIKAMHALIEAAKTAAQDRAAQLEQHDCRNRRCDYDEPHKHGVPCGPRCSCGLGMKAGNE